jgi:type I restriction enzyme S subunit
VTAAELKSSIAHPKVVDSPLQPTDKVVRLGKKMGWQTKMLRDVSAINYGYTESASWEPIGPQFLRITDIQNDIVNWTTVPYCKIDSIDIPKYRLDKNDIVFARTGATTGKSFLVKNAPNAVFASYLIRLRLLDKNLLAEFVALFFQTSEYWQSIKDGSSGSAQGGFNATKLGALSLPVPPLHEQQRIVGILDGAFEGIATAKANAEKNLQNTRELIDELKQLLFSDEFEVAAHDRSLDDLCEIIVDCEHKTAPTETRGIPSIRTPNIGKGKLLLDGVYRVSENTYREWTRRAEPQGGDLILAREAPAGNVAVVPDGLKVCLGQRTVLIRPRRSIFEPDYLAYLLLRKNSQRRLLAHSRGATVQHINLKDIRAFKISVVPSLDEQRIVMSKLNDLLEHENSLLLCYGKKLTALDDLKKSLLHRAFNGDL